MYTISLTGTIFPTDPTFPHVHLNWFTEAKNAVSDPDNFQEKKEKWL
jgi:hypothetical protein